jgi:hypothetical protein
MKAAQLVVRDIVISPRSLASNTTTTARIDCAGANYVTLEIAFAAELNTNATGPSITLKESDTTEATSFATFNASFNRTAEDCTATKVVVYHVDNKPRKRYLLIDLTTPNSSNDVILASVVSNLYKEILPIGTTDQGDVVVIG